METLRPVLNKHFTFHAMDKNLLADCGVMFFKVSISKLQL